MKKRSRNHQLENGNKTKTIFCEKCGKQFNDDRSPEEKLLQAIFSETMCPKCRVIWVNENFCNECENLIHKDKVIGKDGKPYHKDCLGANILL